LTEILISFEHVPSQQGEHIGIIKKIFLKNPPGKIENTEKFENF